MYEPKAWVDARTRQEQSTKSGPEKLQLKIIIFFLGASSHPYRYQQLIFPPSLPPRTFEPPPCHLVSLVSSSSARSNGNQRYSTHW